MDVALWIFLGLAAIGFSIWHFSKKKSQVNEIKTPGLDSYQFRIAHLKAEKKVENKDFVVAIISQSEFQSKTPAEIENWIKEKVGKEGTISDYDVEIGLQELVYTTNDGKVIDVFFLIVEETSQNVIDWQEPKEPETPKPEPTFQPYIFQHFNEIQQTEDSIIYEIIAPDEGLTDVTAYVQDKIDKAPVGSFLAPTIIRFIGKFRTDGDPAQLTHTGSKAAVYFKKKSYFIVEGGEFFTIAPSTLYGGNIGKNDYSHRRHIVFDQCHDFGIRKTYVHGSNFIDGQDIGSSRELTPDFWYQPFKKGYITDPYTGETWQNHTFVPTWYLDERSEQLLTDANLTYDIIALGAAVYYELLKDLLPEGEMVPAPKDNGSVRAGHPAYKSYWEFEHAFDFKYSKNFFVDEVKAYAVWGDGICLGHGNENFAIRNSHISYAGRQGIAVYNCTNGLFEHIYIDGRRAAIDFEPNTSTGWVIGMEVRNCDLRPMQTVIAALGNGKVDDIYIHDNYYASSGTFIHCGDSREITRRKNWVVEDNHRAGGGHGSPGSGVKFDMVDNVVFRRNRESVGATQNRLAARLNRCGGLIYVTDNDFLNASRVHVHNTLPDAVVVVKNNLPEADNGMIELRGSFAAKQGLEVMQPILEVTYDNR